MQTREQLVKGVWSERDSQRRKVYDAETLAWRGHPADNIDFPEVEDVSREVKRLVNSRRLWKAFPFMSPYAPGSRRQFDFKINDGRGARCASGGSTELSFPRHQRKQWVILHELAHLLHAREQRAVRDSMALVGSDIFTRKGYTSAHGWRFCMIYLQLVLWFAGRKAHDELKFHLKERGARIRPPRVMSPEQRAAATERLRAMRPKAEFWRRLAA